MGESSYVDFGTFGVSAEEAAQAFQLLSKYIALGGNSHAEGAQTLACGQYSWAEGFDNLTYTVEDLDEDRTYIIQNVTPVKPIPEEDLRIIFDEEVELDFDE